MDVLLIGVLLRDEFICFQGKIFILYFESNVKHGKGSTEAKTSIGQIKRLFLFRDVDKGDGEHEHKPDGERYFCQSISYASKHTLLYYDEKYFQKTLRRRKRHSCKTLGVPYDIVPQGVDFDFATVGVDVRR